MKIMHVCFSRSWGGLEKNSFDLAVAQKRAGHEILYLCRKGFALDRELPAAGIAHVAFPRILKYIDVPVMMRLRKLVREGDFRVVHVTHTEDLGTVVPALIGLGEAKLFFTLQMNVAGPKKDPYHRMEYGRISKMFMASGVLRDAALKYLPVTDTQLMVVPYGLDLKIYAPARDNGFRASLGYGPENVVLGILARLDPPKGQMEAIQALPAILQKYPSARLLLVGDESVDHHGAETKRVRAEVARLGLGDKVKFLGDHRGAEQARVLNTFDLFLSPSHFETCSTSMMMAELCAVPIVGTNAGGTPEQLGYGKYGELVEPKDPASLAQGVFRVLADLATAKERSAELRRRALERYDMDKIVKIIEAEYLKAISQPSSLPSSGVS